MGAATGRHGDQALNAIQQRIQKPTDTTAPHGHVLSVPFPIRCCPSLPLPDGAQRCPRRAVGSTTKVKEPASPELGKTDEAPLPRAFSRVGKRLSTRARNAIYVEWFARPYSYMFERSGPMLSVLGGSYGRFLAEGEGRQKPSLSSEHAQFRLDTLHMTQPIVENGGGAQPRR